MTVKPESKKKSGSTRHSRHSIDAEDKDQLIAELNNKIQLLEKELRSEHEDATSPGITERKLMDEAMRESEARYRSLFENMLDGVASCEMQFDDQGKPVDFVYLNVNSAFGRLTGLENVVGKKVTEAIPGIKESHPELLEIYSRVARTGRPEKFELEFKPLAAWLLVSVYSTEKGYFTAVFENITERKQAEDKLRGLAAIVESSDDAIISKTLDGIITSWNSSAEKMFGYTADEIIGKSKSILIPPDHADELAVILNKVENDESITHYETVRSRKDGTRVDVSISVSPIKDNAGNIIGAANIIRDITGRKHAEETFRENHRFTSVLIGNLPGVVFRCRNDENWTMEFLSPRCEELTGYSIQDLFYNNKISYAQLINPEDRERVWKEVQAAFHDKKPFITTYRIMTASGEEKWVWTQGRRLFSNRREIIAGYIFDITATKRAEEALNEAKAQAELYVDLMGHDINNMNYSAMGYLEMALEKLETERVLGLDDKLLVERPMQSLANSSALINKVRKLQKLMIEGVKTKPTDLDKIFRELEATSFYTQEQDKGVLINIQHVPGVMVEANELLKDVFVNLITNAVKHSKEEKPLTVDVKVEQANENGRKYYRCTVEDNGPGIPDELKNKLFHRFQRGTTTAQGKGLGLYLVRTLVDGYCGRVWVEDRVPEDHAQGARFVVMLPAVEK